MASQATKDAKKAMNTAKANLDKYSGSFSYNDTNGLKNAYNKSSSNYNYLTSEAGKKANGYNKYMNSWKGSDGKTYDGVNQLFEQVMNNGDFSYDSSKDKLFQMYKTQYNVKGQNAMQNQMGIAAANSGGYNSSYAQTSAQDTYQTYMDELAQKATETYQAAYDRYNDKSDQLNNRLSVLSNMNNTNNEAYNTKVNQAATDRQFAYSAYRDDYNSAQTQYNTDRNYAQTQYSNALNNYNTNRTYDQTEKWNTKTFNQTERWNEKNAAQTERWNEKNAAQTERWNIKTFNQTNYWNRKNNALQRKAYTGGGLGGLLSGLF